MISIELNKISKSFGPVKANQNINLKAKGGEILGLLGENGAGKTTLFNAITGHVKGATGDFILDGKTITGKPIHNRALTGIGRTFQNLNLHDDLNVLEHALLGLDRNIKYGRV